MSQLRTLLRANRLPWIFYVIVSLVFIQSVKLHVHTYSHENKPYAGASMHVQSGQMHFDYNVSQPAAPDEVAEIKLDQSGFKVSWDFFGLALLLLIPVLLLIENARPRFTRRVNPGPLQHWRDALLPPLRAPPLCF